MPKAKPKTIHNDVVTIKQLVNFAVRRRMIRENPLADLELPQPKRTPQPFWRRDQVEQILKATSAKYRSLFHFLADTGTRIGEARWLTWNDVNLDDKVIHIRAKEGWQPKTGDERVIHLSAELCQVLAQLPRYSQWVFTAPRTDRFPVAGRQVSDRRALVHLKTILKKLGLPGHLHTFRHSFVSHALTSGVAESIVRSWVGHIDPEIMKIYTHIADRQSRAAMDHTLPGHLPPQSVGGDQG
jgi:integrase